MPVLVVHGVTDARVADTTGFVPVVSDAEQCVNHVARSRYTHNLCRVTVSGASYRAMASGTRSCCACTAPAPKSQAAQRQHHIGVGQRRTANTKPLSAVCCSAMSGLSSISAPTTPMTHRLLAVDPTAQQTFQERQACCDPDVVIITQSCPYTVASLASSDESLGSQPGCRFPDATVYMSRDTYNDLCTNVAQTKCDDARERATHALELVRCFSTNVHDTVNNTSRRIYRSCMIFEYVTLDHRYVRNLDDTCVFELLAITKMTGFELVHHVPSAQFMYASRHSLPCPFSLNIILDTLDGIDIMYANCRHMSPNSYLLTPAQPASLRFSYT